LLDWASIVQQPNFQVFCQSIFSLCWHPPYQLLKEELFSDLKAEWMASSSSLFIGIDESTKSTKRSFVELEIGEQMCIICTSGVPLTVKEVVSHLAEKMLELILDKLQQIN